MNTSTYTFTDKIQKLLLAYEQATQITPELKKTDTIKVNFVISAAASVYETIRNAIEYREDHLLRRAAIYRILKRLLYLQNNSMDTAESLVRELIWARYLENETIPESKIKEISLIVDRYLGVWQVYNQDKKHKEKRKTFEFLITLCSCEIEEHLGDSKKREALFNFTLETLAPHISLTNDSFTPEEKNLIIRIAVHKALLKSDIDLLSYELFNQFYPGWKENKVKFEAVAADLLIIRRKIKELQESKVTESIYYYCRNNIAPFLVLQEVLEKNLEQVKANQNQTSLTNLIKKVTEDKYSKIRKKLTIATTRSILYIFLTKMLLAFIIEFPYERIVVKNINYVPLIINVLVPPIIMFLVTLTIRVPGEKNTKAIIAYIKGMMYQEVDEEIVDYRTRRKLNGSKRMIFGVFYSIGFFMTFGTIIYFLAKLHFNIVSGMIFLLFLTLVSFFGFMIRQQVRDIALYKGRQGGFAPILDFFAFPIIRTGHLLSGKFQDWNIPAYVFDLFIEAPFKTIIQLFEEWFLFVKERKDEII